MKGERQLLREKEPQNGLSLGGGQGAWQRQRGRWSVVSGRSADSPGQEGEKLRGQGGASGRATQGGAQATWGCFLLTGEMGQQGQEQHELGFREVSGP